MGHVHPSEINPKADAAMAMYALIAMFRLKAIDGLLAGGEA